MNGSLETGMHRFRFEKHLCCNKIIRTRHMQKHLHNNSCWNNVSEHMITVYDSNSTELTYVTGFKIKHNKKIFAQNNQRKTLRAYKTQIAY